MVVLGGRSGLGHLWPLVVPPLPVLVALWGSSPSLSS